MPFDRCPACGFSEYQNVMKSNVMSEYVNKADPKQTAIMNSTEKEVVVKDPKEPGKVLTVWILKSVYEAAVQKAKEEAAKKAAEAAKVPAK